MADDPNPNAALEAQLAAAAAELANAKARITELNNEAKGHRLNGDKHKAEAEAAAKARDDAIAEAARIKAEIEAAAAEKVKAVEAKAAETISAAELRSINADLRIAAKDADARDPSDILLQLDRSKIKRNDAGDVINAAELIAEIKKAKPYLFGAASSANPKEPPSPDPTKPKHAKDMTDAEFKEAEASKAWRGK